MNNKNINKKILIWDLDGTIADSLNFFVNFLHNEAKKLNYNLTKKEIKNMIRNKDLKDIIKEYKFSKIQIFILVWKLRHNFKNVTENVNIYKNTDKILKELSQKYDLYLLTSNDKKHTENFLKKHNIYNLFLKKYYKSSLFGKDKTINKVIKKNNLNKENVIYIGDELRDFYACQKSNIKCINVSYGFNSEKLLKTQNKNLTISKINDIEKILSKI